MSRALITAGTAGFSLHSDKLFARSFIVSLNVGDMSRRADNKSTWTKLGTLTARVAARLTRREGIESAEPEGPAKARGETAAEKEPRRRECDREGSGEATLRRSDGYARATRGVVRPIDCRPGIIEMGARGERPGCRSDGTSPAPQASAAVHVATASAILRADRAPIFCRARRW